MWYNKVRGAYMSILTSASSSSVNRGYDYFREGKVNNINQLNDYEFEGYVDGSQDKPYYVKINIKHPKKSYCDCPHANGNITCKHMTALFFAVSPEEVEDYESWLYSSYAEEEEYEDDFDEDYGDYDAYENLKFEKPLFFDVVLNNYINSLNEKQLRNVLFEALKQDERKTYELFLKQNYNAFLKSGNDDLLFLENLNKKINELTDYINYDYDDFSKKIFTSKEKEKIAELYKNESLKMVMDKILLNEKLAVYEDYNWISTFYKKNMNSKDIYEFTSLLENYFNSLKHYSIRNNEPKANVLINIYLLKKCSLDEEANLIFKNAKYLKFVEYVIYHSNDVKKLYNKYLSLIEKDYVKHREFIPDILYYFLDFIDYEDKNMKITHYLYSYLCLKDVMYLKILNMDLSKNEIISMIENKTKDITLLTQLYAFFDEKSKLWNLLNNSKYQYKLIDNIDVLKDKYNKELYNYFINEFYDTLKEGKNRDVYHEASKYLKAISKLNDGQEYISNIINDLKNSDYQKCVALFDEINKALD